VPVIYFDEKRIPHTHPTVEEEEERREEVTRYLFDEPSGAPFLYIL
jgi:hypothetical protein